MLAQMAEQFVKLQHSLLAVQEVPLAHTRRYGIVAGTAAGEGLIKVTTMIEKPAPEVAPSRMGVAGRYILSPAVFRHIRSQPTGVGGEIQLTDGIASLLKEEPVYAFQYLGKRYDCGSKEGFLEATVELALQHPEVGAHFRSYLKNLALD